MQQNKGKQYSDSTINVIELGGLWSWELYRKKKERESDVKVENWEEQTDKDSRSIVSGGGKKLVLRLFIGAQSRK